MALRRCAHTTSFPTSHCHQRAISLDALPSGHCLVITPSCISRCLFPKEVSYHLHCSNQEKWSSDYLRLALFVFSFHIASPVRCMSFVAGQVGGKALLSCMVIGSKYRGLSALWLLPCVVSLLERFPCRPSVKQSCWGKVYYRIMGECEGGGWWDYRGALCCWTVHWSRRL